MAFDDKKTKDKPEYSRPKICGIPGCAEPCDIYIKEKDISRCSKHYQQDVDRWTKTHRRGSADRAAQQMMADNSQAYQGVKSGTHLMEILKNLYAPGTRK